MIFALFFIINSIFVMPHEIYAEIIEVPDGWGSYIVGGTNNSMSLYRFYIKDTGRYVLIEDSRLQDDGSGGFTYTYDGVTYSTADSTLQKLSVSSWSNILGGQRNYMLGGMSSSIIAGQDNTLNGNYNAIVGGWSNTVRSASEGNIASSSVIVGGQSNIINGQCSVIIGGFHNTIASGSSNKSGVIIGAENSLSEGRYANGAGNVIIGGRNGYAGYYNAISIGGGYAAKGIAIGASASNNIPSAISFGHKIGDKYLETHITGNVGTSGIITDEQGNVMPFDAELRTVPDGHTYTYTRGDTVFELNAGDSYALSEQQKMESIYLHKTYDDESTARLINISAGLNNTDAVNVSQLKKHGTDIASALGGSSSYTFSSSNGTGTLTTALKVDGTTYTSVQSALDAISDQDTTSTWSLKANNGTAYSVGNGGTVNLKNGSNMTITNNGGGNFTFGVSPTPTFTSVKTGNVTMSSTGIAMGSKKVTGLAAGTLSSSSTDAVNGSQLYATNQNLAALDGLAVKYDSESKNSITLGNGTNKVTIKNVADGVNDTDAVNKGQLDKELEDTLAAANAKSKWSLKVNDGAAEEIGDGKVVTLKDGTNIAITKDASGNYVFSTVAAPEFDEITIRNTNISISNTGIDMGDKKIINLQRGDVSEGSSDAVTGGQLYETNQTIEQLDELAVKYDEGSNKTKVTLEGEGGTTITNVKAAELNETSTDAVNGSQLYTTNQNLASLDALVVKYKEGSTNRLELNDGDNYTVRISNVATPENDTDAANKKYVDDKVSDLSEDVEGLDASAVKYDAGSNKTKVTLEGEGGTTITNVKAAELTQTSTDAVNGSQLYATNQNLASLDGLAVKYDDETKTSITLGNGTDNVTIKNVADGVDAKDAVNKGQLDKGLEDTLAAANAKSKWSLKVNDGEAEEIRDGKVVTLKDGTNVAITKDADGNYVFSTIAAPEFDSITISNTNISISNTGINMGGLKITNLQNGDISEGSTDAVTGDQLNETNERVSDLEDGLDTLDGLAVKYDDEGKNSITLEGSTGTKISNVADGVDKSDAVNKGQLDGVKAELEEKIDGSVTEINTRIDGVEEDITNLDRRVTVNENDISIIKDALGDLSGAAVTYDDETKSTVTLKGEDGTKISNIADGTEDSDAVNLGQLNEVRDLSEANAEKIEEHGVYIENHEQEFKTLQTVLGDGYSNPTFNTIQVGNISSDGININMGGGIITGLGDGGIYPGSTDAVTGNQLWNAYKRMDDLQESINIVGAHAAAMSGLHPVPYNPYEPTTLSAAFGTYRDEYAVAVGVFHYVRSNLMFNLGASLCSDGDIMGRAGVSIAVGPNSKKKPELARDMVTMQQIQVQSQYRIQELEAEIAALKQQITQITSASK